MVFEFLILHISMSMVNTSEILQELILFAAILAP